MIMKDLTPFFGDMIMKDLTPFFDNERPDPVLLLTPFFF